MTHCKECGEEVSMDNNYCPKCGERIQKSHSANLWYLFPILFGFIGGIISYLILRNRVRKAWKHLVVGIAVTIAWIAFPILFQGLRAVEIAAMIN